jgi:hypothetical protein
LIYSLTGYRLQAFLALMLISYRVELKANYSLHQTAMLRFEIPQNIKLIRVAYILYLWPQQISEPCINRLNYRANYTCCLLQQK